jgi:hypothetical protein
MFQVTGQCEAGTNRLIETEIIADELDQLRLQVEALRFADYCSSPQPGVRQCLIEYEKYKHNVQEECERAGGHYIESFYKADCEAENSKLVFAATDEPYCVGSSCKSDEASTLVENIIEDKVHGRLEAGGYYSCAITYFRAVQLESRYRSIDTLGIGDAVSDPGTSPRDPSTVPSAAPSQIDMTTSSPTPHASDAPVEDTFDLLSTEPTTSGIGYRGKGMNSFYHIILAAGSLFLVLVFLF